MMKKKLLVWLSALLLLLPFSVCGKAAADASAWQAYKGKRIGVQVGTTSGQQVTAKIPDAVLSYYNNQTDLLAALRSKKIDAWATDETILKFVMMENDDLTILGGYLDTLEYAPIFAKTEKGRALRDQYSAFVDSLWESGGMQELDAIWYGKDESKRTVLDYESLPAANGTLTMAVDTSLAPFSYVKDNRVVGYDVDIAARFCQEYGYRLSVQPMDFGGILSAVQSGKADFAACAITVTEERGESVLFGSSNYKTGAVLAVLKGGVAPAQQSAAASGDAQEKAPITSLSQLKQPGIRLAVGLNTPAEQTMLKDYPDAIITPYSDIFLAYMDVVNGRIDACMNARKEMEFAMQNGLTGVRLLEENYASNKVAVGLSPVSAISDLKGKINAFIAQCRADGTLDDMYDRWVLRGEDSMPAIPQAENPSFTLRVGTTGSVMPYSYYAGTQLAGYDIELAYRFAAWLGAKLEFWVFDFGGIVPAAEAGRIDCIMSNLFYSEERDEAIPFSDVLFEVEITAMVRDDGQHIQSAPSEGLYALSQLDGKRIGVQTGTTFDEIVRGSLPHANISYFNSYPDMAAALEANKIDAFPGDEPVIRLMAAENNKLAVLEERMDDFDFGIALPKTEAGKKLLAEINVWLASMKESGELAQLTQKWTDGPENEKTVPDYASFPAPNGVLTLATEGAYAPMNYYRGDDVVGLEIDLIARFCEANGYGLKVVPMLFDGILPAIQSGKANLAAAGMTITEERKESVCFSDPYYTGGTVMAILKNKAASASQTAATVRWQDYNGKRLGVLVGPLMEDAAKTYFPDSEYLLFNSYPDCIAALLAGKIDAYLGDELGLFAVHAEQPEIDYFHDRITQNNYAFAFRKNDPDSAALCAELNEFLKRSRENGTMEDLESIWYGIDEERKIVDISDLTGENGTIRVVTTSTDAPFSYIKDGKNVGYDIDLVVRFCRDRGYALELGDVDFAGRIPAIQSGKYDFTTDMNVTPERQEQVLFSDPTGYGGIVLAVLSSDLAAADGTQSAAQPEYTEFSDLKGKTVSMLTGAPFEELVRGKAPDVGAFTSFNNTPDMILALQSGKTDAFLTNNAIAALAVSRNHDLAFFPQELQDGSFGFAFAKGDPRRDTWQAAFAAIPQARIRAAWNKWTGADESVKTLPEQDWPGTGGTVRVAVCDTVEPMSYAGGDGRLKGFDLEIILMMAKELDVRVEFAGMDFAAILPSVQTGKADIGASSIIITPERAEAVDFVEYYPASFVLVVRTQKNTITRIGDGETFWDGLRSSFHKTFIRENRWELFLEGVGNTMLITLLSILLGTALGFLVFMLCRNGNIIANGANRFSIWLVTGTPMVVLLMILYYIIFGSVAISGIAVAVIGFTLTFGASVFGLLKMGVGTIDRGQYEAAYALGHSNRHTFFRIILPQAIPHILPAYKGEIVGLIKATAIVGYIAVQDLTKMGDIVRSRTYEAFFPLIAITIIYFVLEGLFGLAVSRIRISIDPKKRRRDRILKGVNTHD